MVLVTHGVIIAGADYLWCYNSLSNLNILRSVRKQNVIFFQRKLELFDFEVNYIH